MNQKRNLGKRIASWLLCMVMVLSIVNLPGFTNTVYAAGYNAGDIPGTTGAGTKSDPVLVDTFTELKAALQCSDNLYIELTGMSDTRTGLDYYELEESRDFNNEAPAIIIPAGTTKRLTISGKIDYRIVALNDTHMQALIANNGGNLYVNGNGSLNVGFAGYTQNLINAVIYNRSGNVYISGYPWITTDKANITNQSLPLYNEGGYMEIDGGYFVGCVNRAGGGNAVALRCGSWATKTVISGGNFSAVNTAEYSESAYAMGVIGSSPVEISGGWFYKGVKTDNGKTLNDYVVSGKKVYKAEEAWEVCDPKVEEVEIKVPPLVVGKDFPVPECVSDNAYVDDYAWYYSDGRTIADGAKVQNTEYKLHVIVYTDDGKMFDWTSCTIHFNDSTGEVYMYGDTFVNTYAYFTPVEIISGSVGVTDYVAPVVGKEPVKPTKPTGVDYNVSQIWYEVPEIGNQADAKTFTGAFEHGKIYCLALTFTALSGKAFDENIKVSVDGNVVEYERLQNNKIRAVLYTALNHDFSAKDVTKATVSANGKIVTKCKGCGEVKSTTTIYYPKTFTLEKTSYEYTGSQIKPVITVKDCKGNVVDAKYYTVTYGTNKAVGKGTVKVTFKGNYEGNKTVEFNITPTKTTIGTPAVAADGITVKWTKNTSAKGYIIYRSVNGAAYEKVKTISDNTVVSWKDTGANVNGNKYQYKIVSYKVVDGVNYKSGYSSVKTRYFVSQPAISSLTSGSAGKMTVKWGKNSKATGYQIQYSTDSTFATYKTSNVTSNTTVSRNFSNLTKGKKYYVRIRSYKTVGDTKYYSAWSSKKSVTIAK